MFAIRFPAIIIFFIVNILLYFIIKEIYCPKTAFIGVVILNLWPAFSFIGSIIALPDSPLALFWLLSVLAFIKIIKSGNKNYWLLFGAAFGFAMLSKYYAVLICSSAFIFLIFSDKYRYWLTKREPYIALLISAAIFSPVIIWNALHDWISFKYQLYHGIAGNTIGFYDSIIQQISFYNPVFIVALFIVIIVLAKELLNSKNIKAFLDSTTFLVCIFSGLTIILFNVVFIFSKNYHSVVHWAAVGYLLSVPLIANVINKFLSLKKYNYIWVLSAVPVIFIFNLSPDKILPVGYANIVYKMQPQLENVIDGDMFLMTDNQYLADILSFNFKEIRVLNVEERLSAFDFWQSNLQQYQSKNAVLVSLNAKMKNGNFFKRAGTDVYRGGILFIKKYSGFEPSKIPVNYAISYKIKNKKFY